MNPQVHQAPPRRWDIFCRVIDNHGDLGVTWRLARQVAAERGEPVRLWVDDASALAWMAPQGQPGVQLIDWSDPAAVREAAAGPVPDVLIEAFGCDPAPELVARFAARPSGIWLNLEYLSAEDFVEGLHGLPSPVMSGPGRGCTKYFFYPGFSDRTGGLLREAGLAQRQARFDRSAWLAAQGVGWQGERLATLFCYEPPALAGWLADLCHGARPTRVLVAAGRTAAAVRAVLPQLPPDRGGLQIDWLPHLPQPDFDHLLWAGDFNAVRGEDSLVRALWAGKPMVWHIYPQDDGVHHDKLDAWLDAMAAPPSVRAFHAGWNGRPGAPALAPFDDALLADAARMAQAARTRLFDQDDLLTRLVRFIAQKS